MHSQMSYNTSVMVVATTYRSVIIVYRTVPSRELSFDLTKTSNFAHLGIPPYLLQYAVVR